MDPDKHKLALWCGLLLLLISCLGLWQAARAGLSYIIYHRAKFDPPSEYGPVAAARHCDVAQALYPYNYYMCIWVSEKCWYARYDSDGEESTERVALAQEWCDRGLALNMRKSQLRRLKTRLLARDSVREAIDHWKDYVDWHFWEPYNHAVLVALYSRTGDYAAAMNSLAWTKGSKHYAEAHLTLQKSWSAEIAPVLKPQGRK